MSNMMDMNPSSGRVLWEGSSNDLTSVATGGRMQSGSYVITEDAVRFASGILSTSEQVIPLWAIIDVDLKQSISQKARGLGNLVLRMDAAQAQRFGQSEVLLKAIKDPVQVRDILVRQANHVRTYWAQRQHERIIETQQAGAAQIAQIQSDSPSQASIEDSTTDGGDDILEKLERLARLKDSGALTDEEFAAAKAKLLS